MREQAQTALHSRGGGGIIFLRSKFHREPVTDLEAGEENDGLFLYFGETIAILITLRFSLKPQTHGQLFLKRLSEYMFSSPNYISTTCSMMSLYEVQSFI